MLDNFRWFPSKCSFRCQDVIITSIFHCDVTNISNNLCQQVSIKLYPSNHLCIIHCHKFMPIQRPIAWKQWLLPTEAMQFADVPGSALPLWCQYTNYAASVGSNHCFQAIGTYRNSLQHKIVEMFNHQPILPGHIT